jgi:hypothetical protein
LSVNSTNGSLWWEKYAKTTWECGSSTGRSNNLTKPKLSVQISKGYSLLDRPLMKKLPELIIKWKKKIVHANH